MRGTVDPHLDTEKKRHSLQSGLTFTLPNELDLLLANFHFFKNKFLSLRVPEHMIQQCLDSNPMHGTELAF